MSLHEDAEHESQSNRSLSHARVITAMVVLYKKVQRGAVKLVL